MPFPHALRHPRLIWAVLVLLNMLACFAFAAGSNFYRALWHYALLLPVWGIFTLGWAGLERKLQSWLGGSSALLLRVSAVGLALLQAVPILQLWAGLLALGGMELLGLAPGGDIEAYRPLLLLVLMSLNGLILCLMLLILAGVPSALWWLLARMGLPLRTPFVLWGLCWLGVMLMTLTLRNGTTPLFDPVPMLFSRLLA